MSLCLFKAMFWSRCDKAVHLQLYQHTTFYDTPQLRLSWLNRKIWLSGINRTSKINVGLGPGSGFKMRPVCNSMSACRLFTWDYHLSTKLSPNAKIYKLNSNASTFHCIASTAMLHMPCLQVAVTTCSNQKVILNV